MKKVLLMLTTLVSTFAVSQVLDPTFGTNGIVTSQLSTSPSIDHATDAILQSDGKYIFIGGNRVYRFFSTGVVDLSFGVAGFKTIGSNLETIALQSDGKIVIGGSNAVYRLNTDGSLDTSFNSTGFVVVNFGSYAMRIKKLKIDSTGKIIAGGYVSNGTDDDFALCSLNTDGTYNTSFASVGKTTFGTAGRNEELFDLDLFSNNDIIVTGQQQKTPTSSNFDVLTVFCSSAGMMFLIDNPISFNSVSQGYKGRAVKVFPDNSFLVAATLSSNTSGQLNLIKYNGNLVDTSFGTLGTGIVTGSSVSTSDLNFGIKRKLVIDFDSTNNKILISCTRGNNYNLSQYNVNGTIDTTFGNTGSVSFEPYLNSTDSSCFLFVTPDNKIITGGTTGYSLFSDAKIITAQFTNTGTLESSQEYHFYQTVDNVFEADVQLDGKIVCVDNNKKLVRFNIDGTIDTVFNSNYNYTNLARNLALQSDDKILFTDDSGMLLSRLNSDGTIDTTFGVGGTVDYLAANPIIIGYIDNITYDSTNNKIYLAFDYNHNSQENPLSYGTETIYGVSRLNYDGSIDTSFGDNGYVGVNFAYYSPYELEWPQKIALDNNGKIVVVGHIETYPYSPSNPGVTGVLRLNSDGSLDTTFGNAGIGISIFNNTYSSWGTDLKITSDNKYLMKQTTYNSGSSTQYSTIVKLNNDGNVDTTFGTSGYLNFSINVSIDKQSDDKILIGSNYSNNQFTINRINTNGTLDTTFGTAGTVITPIGYYSGINKMKILQDNKFYATGYSFDGSSQLATLARYTFDTMGVDDMTTNKDLRFYPNPAKNYINIDISEKLGSTFVLKVTNLLGQEVINKSLTNTNSVELNSLSQGVYIFTVYNEQNNIVKTEKVVVN